MKAKQEIRNINRRGIIVYLTSFTNNDGQFTNNSGFLRTKAEAFARLPDSRGSGGIQRIEKFVFTFDAAKIIEDYELQDFSKDDIEEFVFENGLFDSEDKGPVFLKVIFEQEI